ncbi:hypothetical protein CVT25_006274, partial [Psilocybe cyanescens]
SDLAYPGSLYPAYPELLETSAPSAASALSTSIAPSASISQTVGNNLDALKSKIIEALKVPFEQTD